METSSARTRLLRGNHGQEQTRRSPRTEVQRDFPAEDRGRPVGFVVVDEGSAAAHGIFHIGEGRSFPVVLVVFSADRERDAKSRRHDDAGRPDFEVELDDFAGLQGLLLVVGVVRTVMQRAHWIELPLRCAQPALSDGRARVERALERDLLSLRVEHAQHREDVRVGGGRGDEELERRRPGDLGFAPERRGGEGHAFARRVVGNRPFSAKRRRRQPHFLRIEVEMRPRRARERPFALVAQHEFFTGMPDLPLHARLPVPAVGRTLEEMIEEAFLKLDSVVGVERRPVRPAVHLQPFLPGCRARKPLEVAARVQSLPAPVRGREQRDCDFGEIGCALAVVGTVEGPREQLLPHVFAVLLELLGRERLGAAYGLSGNAAPRAALALPVLHRFHLHVLPILAEAADDAAVAVAVAVAVAPAFPNADRRKMRRLRRGGAPLVARVIGDAVHSHLSAAPGLHRRPLDAQVDVARLARVEWAAVQAWCSGKVGMNGISYYASNQWRAAASQPPHLAAICVWEGWCDSYRDGNRHGGIICSFRKNWQDMQVKTVQHGQGERGARSRVTGESVCGPETLSPEELQKNRENMWQELLSRPLDGPYYRERTADLSKVTVPLLSSANWGGQGLHTRGNFEGFAGAASRQKWLEVHGGSHWAPFYTDYGVKLQKRFFDHFLKGAANGWDRQARVQLQVRHPGEKFVLRHENEWPLARTTWTHFHLDPKGMRLSA